MALALQENEKILFQLFQVGSLLDKTLQVPGLNFTGAVNIQWGEFIFYTTASDSVTANAMHKTIGNMVIKNKLVISVLYQINLSCFWA